jgi:hypothetical protein
MNSKYFHAPFAKNTVEIYFLHLFINEELTILYYYNVRDYILICQKYGPNIVKITYRTTRVEIDSEYYHIALENSHCLNHCDIPNNSGKTTFPENFLKTHTKKNRPPPPFIIIQNI